MKRKRIEKICKVCGGGFSVRPSEVNAFATCSKPCSLLYRSQTGKGRKMTWGHKVSEKLKGRKCPWTQTDEYRAKMSEVMSGKELTPWCKGLKLSEETRKKISAALTGKKSGGWKYSIEIRERMSKNGRGERCHFWKGGVTPKNKLIRQGLEYKLWREQVFERDSYTCQHCNTRGGRLQAHHILAFSTNPEKRFDLDNGMTLCVECHKKTDTYLKNPKKATEGCTRY